MRAATRILCLCLCPLLYGACGLDTRPASLGRVGGSGASGGGTGAALGAGGTGGAGGGQAASGGAPGTGGGGPGTGGSDASGGQPGSGCAIACDDGLFCNGVERCQPADPRADANGCTRVPPACLRGQDCDEATRRCVTDCAVSSDADADGHDAIECGGDDCDDAALSTSPGALELCNGVDDNCDGVVDNGLAVVACPLRGAVGACMAGSCHVVTCVGNALDCDGNAANGCELTDGVKGDCLRVDCAGATVPLDSDLPDAGDCQEVACTAGVPSVTDLADGESCGRNKECQAGACVDAAAKGGNGNGG